MKIHHCIRFLNHDMSHTHISKRSTVTKYMYIYVCTYVYINKKKKILSKGYIKFE